jgi:DNA-binding transcriptional LysR family regulator
VDLRQLAYFLAVVDNGGVTAAATALHIAQPSLSQAIRGLERELGVPLFERDGRRVALTGAGRALVEPARQVLRDLTAARTAVDDVVGLGAGRLDLAAHDLLAVDPLAAVLGRFHRRHPGIGVRLHPARDEDEMVRLVLDGRCELALNFLPVHDAGLVTRELGAQEVWVALPPGTSAPPDPMPVAALAGRPLVVAIEEHEAVRGAVRKALRLAGIRLDPAVISRHREAIVPLVLAGAGVAFVNRWYATEAARSGALTRRLDPPIWCGFGLVHRTAGLSPAASAFVAMLVDAAGPVPQQTLDL